MTEYVRFHCPQCADPSPVYVKSEGWIEFTKEYHEITSGHPAEDILAITISEEEYNARKDEYGEVIGSL